MNASVPSSGLTTHLLAVSLWLVMIGSLWANEHQAANQFGGIIGNCQDNIDLCQMEMVILQPPQPSVPFILVEYRIMCWLNYKGPINSLSCDADQFLNQFTVPLELGPKQMIRVRLSVHLDTTKMVGKRLNTRWDKFMRRLASHWGNLLLEPTLSVGVEDGLIPQGATIANYPISWETLILTNLFVGEFDHEFLVNLLHLNQGYYYNVRNLRLGISNVYSAYSKLPRLEVPPSLWTLVKLPLLVPANLPAISSLMYQSSEDLTFSRSIYLPLGHFRFRLIFRALDRRESIVGDGGSLEVVGKNSPTILEGNNKLEERRIMFRFDPGTKVRLSNISLRSWEGPSTARSLAIKFDVDLEANLTELLAPIEPLATEAASNGQWPIFSLYLNFRRYNAFNVGAAKILDQMARVGWELVPLENQLPCEREPWCSLIRTSEHFRQRLRYDCTLVLTSGSSSNNPSSIIYERSTIKKETKRQLTELTESDILEIKCQPEMPFKLDKHNYTEQEEEQEQTKKTERAAVNITTITNTITTIPISSITVRKFKDMEIKYILAGASVLMAVSMLLVLLFTYNLVDWRGPFSSSSSDDDVNITKSLLIRATGKKPPFFKVNKSPKGANDKNQGTQSPKVMPVSSVDETALAPGLRGSSASVELVQGKQQKVSKMPKSPMDAKLAAANLKMIKSPANEKGLNKKKAKSPAGEKRVQITKRAKSPLNKKFLGTGKKLKSPIINKMPVSFNKMRKSPLAATTKPLETKNRPKNPMVGVVMKPKSPEAELVAPNHRIKSSDTDTKRIAVNKTKNLTRKRPKSAI